MPKDFLLNADGDIAVSAGDLVIGESTYQQQQALLLTMPGELKQEPTVGVGLQLFIKDNDIQAMLQAINYQFTKDGMTVSSIKFSDGKLNVKAQYEDSNS